MVRYNKNNHRQRASCVRIRIGNGLRIRYGDGEEPPANFKGEYL